MSLTRLGPALLVMGLLASACGTDTGTPQPTPATAAPEGETSPAETATSPTPTPATAAPCIDSGTDVEIQTALTDPGSEAVLCPNAVFELYHTITITAADQKIYTQGFPTDDSRALLIVSSKEIATAVEAGNHDGAELRNLIVDGNKPELGEGPPGALLEWGGAASGHLAEWVKAFEPRGWSVLYIGEGDDRLCTNATARYNELGPSGDHVFGMADGISLACRNSTVEYNTVIDATDGGIVIFQAPGSLVAHNTIISQTRIAYYGISMEDYGPFDGDFTGTRVVDNTIDAAGALIRRGLAMGPRIGCIPVDGPSPTNRGAVVLGNTLRGTHMGYGFVVSGVADWTVTDNIDNSTHLVPPRPSDCFGEPVDPPDGFQRNADYSSGTFQKEFQAATLGFTTDWWPNQYIASQECLSDLVGGETLDDIRNGRSGDVWDALMNADNSEHLNDCKSVYEPPPGESEPGMIQVGVGACESEPYCARVEMINVSDNPVDMSNAQFILQNFVVECAGLPDRIEPWETATCIIDDFVADGFQALWYYGFPPGGQHWGFNYPFE